MRPASALRKPLVAALALATAGLAGVGVVAGCFQRPEPELRVGNVNWVADDLIEFARDRGDFGDHPIRLVPYPTTYEVVRAFKNRAIDVASLTSYEVLQMLERGERLRVVLLLDVSLGGDALVAKAPIRSLEGLKRKRVGLEFDTVGAYVLARALESGGLAQGAVTMVPTGVLEHETALRSGEVDAVVTFEPHRSRLLAEGARELYSTRQIPYEVADMLVVHDDAWDQHPEALKALAAAWGGAVEAARRDPHGVAQTLAAPAGLSAEKYLAALNSARLFDLAENRALLGGRDPALLNGLGEMAGAMRRHGMLRRPVDPAPALDDRAVRGAAP